MALPTFSFCHLIAYRGSDSESEACSAPHLSQESPRSELADGVGWGSRGVNVACTVSLKPFMSFSKAKQGRSHRGLYFPGPQKEIVGSKAVHISCAAPFTKH